MAPRPRWWHQLQASKQEALLAVIEHPPNEPAACTGVDSCSCGRLYPCEVHGWENAPESIKPKCRCMFVDDFESGVAVRDARGCPLHGPAADYELVVPPTEVVNG